MKQSVFWALTKKEFMGFVNSPIAYVILVPFLLLVQFLFFRTALVMGDANLRPFIELLPWFLLVIGPALAMRSFADEQRKQTLELLFAHPVSEWVIVGAKFAGLYLFYLVMLVSTFILPITLMAFSKPDLGLMVGQYLGAAFTGSLFLAVGLMTSVLVGSAVGSFLLGAAINFMLMVLGLSFIILMIPGAIGRFVSEVAVQSHVTNFSRGVLDLRDVLYFATMVAIAITASVLKLSERKVAESRKEKSKLTLIMGLVIGVGVLGNLLLYEYPLQLDMTQDQRYSLSAGTKKLLKDLPDRVTVTLYTSDNLPGPMQVTLRDTGDVLKDFQRTDSKLQVRTVQVSADPAKQQEVQQKGIRQVQFNQIGSSSFQVQTGYLGLETRYGDKTDVIDFVDDASNLEYELARRILKLTRTTQPKIGLIQTAQSSNYTVLNKVLSDQYSVVNISDTTKPEEWKDLVGVVVIDDGSGSKSATPSAELKSFLQNNGGAAFLIDGVAVEAQALSGTKNTSPFMDLTKNYGIVMQPDLVYDLQRNEAITMGSGSMQYIVSYPFWVRPTVDSKNAPWAGVTNAVLGWASAMKLNDTNGWQAKALLETSRLSGTQEDAFTLAPSDIDKLPAATGQVQTVGAVASKNNQRVVVIGDTQFASDDFLNNSQENQTLASNMVDYVAADPVLTTIPRRTAGRNLFVFSGPGQIQVVQIVAIVGPPIVVAGLGFWWLGRRRRLTRRHYAE